MIKYLLAIFALAPTMAFAGLRYQADQTYWEQQWADMSEATLEAYEARQEAIYEAQYEAQLQQQLDAIAALQQDGYQE